MVFPSSAPFPEDFRSNVFPQPLIVPIACSSVWEAHASLEGGVVLPDVGFVEPMLRRRLSPLAKMTLRVAYDCARDVPDVRIVYASRHGELLRTTTMLESLAAKEELSPTLFSMSVLNASAAYSLYCKKAPRRVQPFRLVVRVLVTACWKPVCSWHNNPRSRSCSCTPTSPLRPCIRRPNLQRPKRMRWLCCLSHPQQ